jgi:hypothetical protein
LMIWAMLRAVAVKMTSWSLMVGSKVRAGAGRRAKGCPSAAGGRG